MKQRFFGQRICLSYCKTVYYVQIRKHEHVYISLYMNLNEHSKPVLEGFNSTMRTSANLLNILVHQILRSYYLDDPMTLSFTRYNCFPSRSVNMFYLTPRLNWATCTTFNWL